LLPLEESASEAWWLRSCYLEKIAQNGVLRLSCVVLLEFTDVDKKK
jgi:hypothetical protein